MLLQHYHQQIHSQTMNKEMEFMRKNKTTFHMNLSTLLYAHSILSKIQMNQGYLILDDMFQSLQEAVSIAYIQINQLEMNLFTSLLIDVCGMTLFSPGKFKMPWEMIGNDIFFAKNLLSILTLKKQDSTNPVFDQLLFDANNFLYFKTQDRGMNSGFTRGNKGYKNEFEGKQSLYYKPNISPSLHHMKPTPTPQWMPSKPIERLIPQKNVKQQSQPQSHSIPSSISPQVTPINADINDPLTKFMAMIRKSGLDILTSMASQDKMLASIYAAVNTKHFAALRELIDMTLIIKDSKLLSQVEQVSKTKIRGLLALLKQSGSLTTEILEGGKAVRLIWAEHIHSFNDIRKAHDQYIRSLLTENQIILPNDVLMQLTWMFDDNVRQERLEMINIIIHKVTNYLETIDKYNSIVIPDDETASMLEIERKNNIQKKKNHHLEVDNNLVNTTNNHTNNNTNNHTNNHNNNNHNMTNDSLQYLMENSLFSNNNHNNSSIVIGCESSHSDNDYLSKYSSLSQSNSQYSSSMDDYSLDLSAMNSIVNDIL